MMQMLDAGGLPLLADEVRPADASNPRGYLELAAVKATARDSGWVDLAQGRAVKVIDALLEVLPAERDYRVIVLRRPIAEVLVSQRDMLARLGGARELHPDDSALGPQLEARLQGAVDALRWRPRAALLEVPYRVLVGGPAGWSDRVDAVLGGGLDVGAMASVVDAALYRARRPPN